MILTKAVTPVILILAILNKASQIPVLMVSLTLLAAVGQDTKEKTAALMHVPLSRAEICNVVSIVITLVVLNAPVAPATMETCVSTTAVIPTLAIMEEDVIFSPLTHGVSHAAVHQCGILAQTAGHMNHDVLVLQ